MEAYRRHIVVDNINKVVYIEVQHSFKGHPKLQEYQDIKNGNWSPYVPAEMRDQFRDIIGNGYRLTPMLNQGGKNEQYYIIQVVSIEHMGVMT